MQILLYKIFNLATANEGIIAAHVVTDKNGDSKGFGFVEFSNQEIVCFF
jgi:hypothetical protein